MKLTVLASTLFLLAGCATPLEYVHKTPKKEAVVRYSADDKDTDYKTKVDEEAKSFCEGQYKIRAKQKALSDATAPTEVAPDATTVSLNPTDNKLASYDYVEFVCK